MSRRAESPALLRLFAPDLAEQEAAAQAELDRATHDRLRIHEADLTPPDMAGQACWALRECLRQLRTTKQLRILDPTAGGGPFPAAARDIFPGCEIVGCEARIEEEFHLAHNCDHYYIGDFFDIFADNFSDGGEGDFDLVITNPPFTLIPDLLRRCLELVRPGGFVAFVCRLTWGDAQELHHLWRTVKMSLEFAGRWRFRVGKNPKTGKPYGVDSVGYRLLIWQRDGLAWSASPEASIPMISMAKLDPLPLASRRWRKTASGMWVKPGTEYLHGPSSADPLEALPAVPWRAAA